MPSQRMGNRDGSITANSCFDKEAAQQEHRLAQNGRIAVSDILEFSLGFIL